MYLIANQSLNLIQFHHSIYVSKINICRKIEPDIKYVYLKGIMHTLSAVLIYFRPGIYMSKLNFALG